MTNNLPNWLGAAEVYTTAYAVLARMAQAGHVKISWRKCYPSEEMNSLIDALNKGNEERVKGLLLSQPYFQFR